jgi:tetratricopeptide (TPR) repeat protein
VSEADRRLAALLTNQRPFDGDSPISIMSALLKADPPRPSLVAPGSPPALDRVCLQALAKAPEQRPTAAGLGQAVRAARRPPQVAPPRNVGLILALVGGALGLLAVLGGILLQDPEGSPSTQPLASVGTSGQGESAEALVEPLVEATQPPQPPVVPGPDPAAALADLREHLDRLDPTAARASLRAVPARLSQAEAAEALLSEGRLADLELDFPRATGLLERLLRHPGATGEQRYQALLLLALLADPLANPTVSSRRYSEAQRADPTRWEAFARGGLLLLYSGQWEAAKRDLDRALELAPSTGEVLTNYATYVWTVARELEPEEPRRAAGLAEARRLVDRAIELEPANAEAWSIRAWILRGDEATTELQATDARQALSLFRGESTRVAYFAARGRELIAGGQPDAPVVLRRALAENRRHPVASTDMGWFLITQAQGLEEAGRLDKAAQAYHSARTQLRWSTGLNAQYGRPLVLRAQVNLASWPEANRTIAAGQLQMALDVVLESPADEAEARALLELASGER